MIRSALGPVVGSAISTSAAVAAALVLAACGGGDAPSVNAGSTSSGGSSSSWSGSTTTDSSDKSSSSSSSTSTSPAAAYAVGMCLSRTYAQTDCNSNHAFEVTAVAQTSQYSGDVTKRNALRNFTCIEKAAAYTGGPAYGTIMFGNPVPLANDPEADKRIVCVISRDKPDDSGLQEMNSSAKDFFKKNPVAGNNLCLESVASSDTLKFVDCTSPHEAESTGGFINGKFGDAYPGETKLSAEALKKCIPISRGFVGSNRSDLVPSQNSAGSSPWSRGSQGTACFIQTKGGVKLDKTVYKLGDKALPKAS